MDTSGRSLRKQWGRICEEAFGEKKTDIGLFKTKKIPHFFSIEVLLNISQSRTFKIKILLKLILSHVLN